VDDGGEETVELYARSVDKALGPICKGIDATAGTIVFEDGSLITRRSRGRCRWSGRERLYSLEVGINGTRVCSPSTTRTGTSFWQRAVPK
jgi:hypothetical protein